MDAFLESINIRQIKAPIKQGVTSITFSEHINQGTIHHPNFAIYLSKDNNLFGIAHATHKNYNHELITTGIEIGEEVDSTNPRFKNNTFLYNFYPKLRRTGDT